MGAKSASILNIRSIRPIHLIAIHSLTKAESPADPAGLEAGEAVHIDLSTLPVAAITSPMKSWDLFGQTRPT